MIVPFILFLTLAGQIPCARANRLEGGGSLDINWKYLPALINQSKKANHWRLMTIEFMSISLPNGKVTAPHFHVRVTTDQAVRTDGLDNPILYDLRTTAAPDYEDIEHISGYPPRVAPWRDVNRIASMKGPFPEKRDDGTTKDITLGRLVDCVNIEGLRGEPGKCLLFTMRVMRFVLGECKCGECGNRKTEQIDKVQKLSAAAQARVEGDEAGLANVLDEINRLKKSAPNQLSMILYGVFHPKDMGLALDTAKIVRATKAVIEQLKSLAGSKSDVKLIR